LTSTRLTPYYSESTIFNFLLIPILPTHSTWRHAVNGVAGCT
jgi:hypothetical protein